MDPVDSILNGFHEIEPVQRDDCIHARNHTKCAGKTAGTTRKNRLRKKKVAEERVAQCDLGADREGKDTIPIIMRLIAHSSKWRADELFEDKLPRNIRQIFPQESASSYLEILASF